MKKSFFIVSFGSLMIVACGQTGPLMLPVQDQPDDKVIAPTLMSQPETIEISQPQTTDSVTAPVPSNEKN